MTLLFDLSNTSQENVFNRCSFAVKRSDISLQIHKQHLKDLFTIFWYYVYVPLSRRTFFKIPYHKVFLKE